MPPKVGSSGTWRDEMNQKIDRMPRQLSFDSITSDTLAKYESNWGHWRIFCKRRVQADGPSHGPRLP